MARGQGIVGDHICQMDASNSVTLVQAQNFQTFHTTFVSYGSLFSAFCSLDILQLSIQNYFGLLFFVCGDSWKHLSWSKIDSETICP